MAASALPARRSATPLAPGSRQPRKSRPQSPARAVVASPLAHGQSELKLLGAAQAGGAVARQELVERHLGLVKFLAYRYRGLGLSFDDLVQEGALGLLEAIDRFDPGRNA